MATHCRLEFNLYMKNCNSVTQSTNWFVTDIWRLRGNYTCRHLDLLTVVRFSLNIKNILYVIWEKQDHIWTKIFCIPKSKHSRTPMTCSTCFLSPITSVFPCLHGNAWIFVKNFLGMIFLCVQFLMRTVLSHYETMTSMLKET